MPVVDKNTLKSYFNAGDVPNESNYADLIDTMGDGDMKKSVYDPNNDGIVAGADAAPWGGITGKPATFPPSGHQHAGGDIVSAVGDSNALGGVPAGYFVQGANSTRTYDISGQNMSQSLASGFFNGYGMAGAPGAGWWHFLHGRHTNEGNNYSWDLASDFYSADLRYRCINNNTPTPWQKILLADDTNRPGVTRLYRADDNSGYSVRVTWDGFNWWLKGYNTVDAYHSPCAVGYATTADSANKVRGSTGGVYVPINENYISNGGNVDPGTYNYNLTSYGVPAYAKAVYMRVSAVWDAASSNNNMLIRAYGATNNYGICIRSNTVGVSNDGTGIVRTDESSLSRISMIISGAQSHSTYALIAGYFI